MVTLERKLKQISMLKLVVSIPNICFKLRISFFGVRLTFKNAEINAKGSKTTAKSS